MEDTKSALYPEILPYYSEMLEVGNGHVIYIEQCGNSNGIPLLNLHGGPGSGCNEKHRRRFNPSLFRIISFDQRGAGRSQPKGLVKENTTQHLVEDVEKIRLHLDIQKWVFFGHSWGSTLAFAYAQKFPKHVEAMIVGGILLGTEEELNWLGNPVGDVLESPRLVIQKHYAKHKFFLEADQLLKNMPKIEQIPVHIIHGGSDTLTLPRVAEKLHDILPLSTMTIIEGCGHYSNNVMEHERARIGDLVAFNINEQTRAAS